MLLWYYERFIVCLVQHGVERVPIISVISLLYQEF